MIRREVIENLISCCLRLNHYRVAAILPHMEALRNFREDFNTTVDSIPSFLTSGISHNNVLRLEWNTNRIDFIISENSLKGQSYSAIYVSKLLSETKLQEFEQSFVIHRIRSAGIFPIIYFT